MNRRDFFHRSAIAAAGVAIARELAPEQPRKTWLYLADGPLGPGFVSPSIITPYGRTNVVADGDGTEHFYTVFHETADVMFFAHDPTGELVAARARENP